MGNLFERIKETIRNLAPAPKYDVGQEPTVPGETPEDTLQPVKRLAYLNEASMIHAIRQCARQRLLVYILYNNTWRHVECYSLRPGKSGLFLYGHCLIHQKIHSFYIHRIQELQPTTIPFAPRWFIEL